MKSLPAICVAKGHMLCHWRLVLLSLMLFSSTAVADARSDYLLHCSGCHLENGSSSPPDVPDLRETLGFLSSFAAGRAYLVKVPGVSQAPLSDAKLAEVMNWMLNNYQLKQPSGAFFTEKDIAAHRGKPLYDPGVLRASLLEKL